MNGVDILAAHNEDDLPFMERVICQRCARTCYLGPRQTDYRKANRCVVYCFTCAALAYGQSGLPLKSLDNPLS
jgi:hypothetical protein